MEIIPRSLDPRSRIGPVTFVLTNVTRHIRKDECDPGRLAAVKWPRPFYESKPIRPKPGMAHTTLNQNLDHTLETGLALGLAPRVDWTTWWPWRGAYTRSHPELGREIPQRPWYCVLRHGRVGRRQVFQSTFFRWIPPPPTRGGAAR